MQTSPGRGFAAGLFLLLFAVLGGFNLALGGDELGLGNRLGRLIHGRVAEAVGPAVPLTVRELSNEIDRLGEAIRNDGIVVIKQPDVYSQARLTRHRKEFDNEMLRELGSFALVLSARIGRIDAATTTQATSLGAALSPPGTTHVSVPTPPAIPTPAAPEQVDFSNSVFKSMSVGQGTGNLGLEPTVYLDEKKRFLEHLDQIRRISMGPDQNDSSGYGLYLVRLPASITPGECTYEGHGAEVSISVEHEFRPDFLPTTFRNLVINDVVDQLGPLVYEVLRTNPAGGPPFRKLLADKGRLEAERMKAMESLKNNFMSGLVALTKGKPASELGGDLLVNPQLVDFVVRQEPPGREALVRDAVVARLQAVADAISSLRAINPDRYGDILAFLQNAIGQVRSDGITAGARKNLVDTVETSLFNLLLPMSTRGGSNCPRNRCENRSSARCSSAFTRRPCPTMWRSWTL